jgi:PAS domain S-box-containing protein
MTDLTDLGAGAAAALVLGALPDVGLIVVMRDLRVALAAGRTPIPSRLDSGEIEGRAIAQVLARDEWQVLEPLLAGAFEGERGSVEMQAVADGRWYAIDVEPLPDADGGVVGAVCVWRDITERRRLVEEFEWRGRLMDLAHDAIIVRAPATSSVTYWNREASEIYGYSAEEAIGRITHDLLATEFPASLEVVDRALLVDGRWEGELRHLRKDGRRIRVSSRQALLRGERGEPQAIIELNSDITARAEAEAELRLQAEIMRNMAEGVVLVRTSDWTIAFANPKFEEMFGYGRGELRDQPVEILIASVDQDPREVAAAIRAALAAQGEWFGEVRNVKKDGTAFWCQANVSNFEHPDHGVVSVAVLTDVDERRAAEEERLRLASMVDAAVTLQRSILGPVERELPDGVAARYQPAVRPLEVGGDWYDVVKLPAGKLGLVVGDCVGRGIAAAAVMGQLRSVLHSLMLQGKAPAEVLSDLDVFAQRIPAAHCTTVFCAIVDPVGRTVRYASAGHPPAVLAHRQRPGELLEAAPSVPLAVGGVDRLEAIATLTPGCTLALYTDGLVERRREPLEEGVGRLRSAIERSHDQPVQSLADVILKQLQANSSDDDVALLLYRLPLVEPPRFSTTIPADPATLAGLRRELRAWLAGSGYTADHDEILVSVCEACSNSIEHAYRFDPSGKIDVRAQIDGSHLTATISDTGQWKVPDPNGTQRGRGLTLIKALMSDYTIETGSGTSVHIRKELAGER